MKVYAEPIAWILRGLDDGVAYGEPFVVVASLAIGQDLVADVRGILSTRDYDSEMSEAIKDKCSELGATAVRMVRFKHGERQAPILLTLKPRSPE